MANQRLFYAIEAVALAPLGSITFTAVKGAQAVGITTKYNLEQAFELGQLAIYQNIETMPDVEATLSKVLDGNPLIWHLATYGAGDASLVGRSAQRASLAMSIFGDTQQSSSGTPVAQCVLSGVFVSSLSYEFKVDGNSMESVTFVGNNKTWFGGQPYTFSGGFLNTDSPASPLGIDRREHFVWGSSTVPTCIPGISSSGTNDRDSQGNYGAHVQSIKPSASLGRDNLLELGRRGPYFRYISFPVEVKCDIEIIAVSGDAMGATEEGVLGNGANLRNETINLRTYEGTRINLGTKNKLQSVNYNGASAGGKGNNAMITYSFITFNDFTVTSPQDPTTALRA